MRCYFTGEECDCGGDMETECPHDEMEHDYTPEGGWADEDECDDLVNLGRREAETSERLDECRASRR